MDMKFKIHYECADGLPDQFIIEGDTIEECQTKAQEQINRISGFNPRSEVIEE